MEFVQIGYLGRVHARVVDLYRLLIRCPTDCGFIVDLFLYNGSTTNRTSGV